MKGMVFTEFLEMVEDKFSADMVDDIIDDSAPPSGGAYTAVGTYDHNELVGMVVALSQRSGLPLFLGSYPITPASDILHELSRHKEFGVVTYQAEDEIAAICYPLVQKAAQVRFLRSLGLKVDRGADGRPLVNRAHYDQVRGTHQEPDRAAAGFGPNWSVQA